MANTLSLTITGLYKPDGETNQLRLMEVANLTRSITSALIAGGIQNVGTSAENLSVGEISSEGWAFFRNMDATNFVEIGWDATGFQSAFKLLAGDVAVVPLNPSRTWQAKADTAAVNLYFQICGTP